MSTIECPYCHTEFSWHAPAPDPWSVVLERVRMGDGRFKSCVIATVTSRAEAEKIAARYRATGYAVKVTRDGEVKDGTWRAWP